MQQWLYRIQPVRPQMLSEGLTPEEDAITTQHFNYLNALMQAGVVILPEPSQTTDYSSFGIIIFKAEDETAAWEIVHNDPAVQAKQFCAKLYPYRIALLEPENV